MSRSPVVSFNLTGRPGPGVEMQNPLSTASGASGSSEDGSFEGTIFSFFFFFFGGGGGGASLRLVRV